MQALSIPQFHGARTALEEVPWPMMICTALQCGRRRSRSCGRSSTVQNLISAVVPSSAAKAASAWPKSMHLCATSNGYAARMAPQACAQDIIENASEVGRARQAEVSSSNRFAARGPLRGLGLGRKE